MITTTDVAQWLGLELVDPNLTTVVAAVNSYVETLPDIAREIDGNTWAAQTNLAATMLAARLHRRRNSPNGIESFSEGMTTYVSRYDSDISRMLRIDAFKRPVIG